MFGERVLTIAPAATSRTIELPFANAFQIPRAVPNNESSPTKMGIEAIKVMALVDRANEEMRIGQRGWTVVRPMRAKTMM